MHRFVFAIALLLPLLSLPARGEPNSPTEDIAALVRSQTDLLTKKDAAALAALFTADAVYATASGELVSGRESIANYYSKVIVGLGEMFSRTSEPDEIHIAGSIAWALGHGRTVVKTNQDTAVLRDHWMAVYELVDGRWKIRALSLAENVAMLPAR